MKVNPVGSITSLSDMLNSFKNMPKKDQKRFAQCFNCEHLNNCTKDKKDEDEDGSCKFYKELPKRKSQDFADLLGNAMLNHLKEDNNKNA